MKKLVLLATIALAATPALASKARLSALQSPAHISDIQDALSNPSKALEHGDWVTFEMGQTATTTSTTNDPKAEGGFSRSMGEARYGFYLGNTPAWVTEFRTSTMTAAENPFDFYYASKAGDMAWGAGLFYSNSDRKSSKTKQTATGLNFGVAQSNWDAYLNLGLTNTFKNENTNNEFKGSSAVVVGGNYIMDNMTYFASIGMNGAKTTSGSSDLSDNKSSLNEIGAEYSMKKDGADFYYGAKLSMSETKESVADSKTTTTNLPVWVGIEADATSWMVMRASVSQTILLGTTKTTTGGTGEADTLDNNTKVAAGVGLKFGKLTLDGTLEAASSSTAAINGNALLANAGLTYMF
jgi:hypothetical protein